MIRKKLPLNILNMTFDDYEENEWKQIISKNDFIC